jgi:hypothetical protein
VKFAASNYYWEPLFELCFSKEKPAKNLQAKNSCIDYCGRDALCDTGGTGMLFLCLVLQATCSLAMIIGKNPSLL